MIKEASCLFPIASKGAYFDLPACLANTDKHRHWAGRSQQKFGLLRKFMFGTQHPQSFPLNRRVSELPLWGSGGLPGQAGSRADGTAEPSFRASGATVPQKPHVHYTDHLPARSWASLLQSIHSKQPFPQYKRATPTYTLGVLMKKPEYGHFGAPLNAFPPAECVRDLIQSLLNQNPALTQWVCSTGAALFYQCLKHWPCSWCLLLSICFPNRRKSPTGFQGSQIGLVC